MRKFLFLISIVLCCSAAQHLNAQSKAPRLTARPLTNRPLRWQLSDKEGISWLVKDNNPHTDHIEMSGMKVSAIITYGIDSAQHLVLRRKLIFPTLRKVPNDTRGSLIQTIDENSIDSILVAGQLLREQPAAFYINGCLKIVSVTNTPLTVERMIYPSTDKAACIEKYTLTNTGLSTLNLQIPAQDKNWTTDPAKGVEGAYTINYRTYGAGGVDLSPKESFDFYIVISARKSADQPFYMSAGYELEKRLGFVNRVGDALTLHTPNDTLDRMFAFAKIRAAESIFDTKGGLMHGPGGGDYYAAIWANDQAEYMGPFFPFLGYAAGNESAINCYRLFAKYMNPQYRPIPSSIVAEGADVWNGAGDRGDQAMIAYGACRFALAYGDTVEARSLWPLITWCLEYLQRQKTADGVIPSQSDELEGRFPAGRINLSTNTLAYGALIGASRLARTLGKTSDAKDYEQQADALKNAIDKYFGAAVQGYNTYRYYEGNTTLRSWICLPLVMGIFDRRNETIRALLSNQLWSPNGILTESGSKTFWDRATLYAFRGLFYAGVTDTTLSYFDYYSAMRLLGEHVPYAVEAWPEGDQRHLSAESGLYCRAVTEGLFGIQPISFNSFTLSPRLPRSWNKMSLDHIRAFNHDFDIKVIRSGTREKIIIYAREQEPDALTPHQTGETKIEKLWDGKSPLKIVLNSGPAAQRTTAAGQPTTAGTPPSVDPPITVGLQSPATVSAGQPTVTHSTTHTTTHSTPRQSTPGLNFRSSDTAMTRAFQWAKQMALHYKGNPSDPVGPWYESALPPRFAFCMRDVSHQCIGGELLGLSRENKNMFTKFVGNISGSKDWCSYWEMDKWNKPAPADYRNDKEFWYNLDANFDLLHACWRMYLWTGDTTYIKNPVFRNFIDKSMHEYIDRWVLQPDSLLTRPAHPNHPIPFDETDAFHRCRGLPSYSEGVPNLKLGIDLGAAIYRSMLSYADILQLDGKLTEAQLYRQKATAYRSHIDSDWWDANQSLYNTYYTNDDKFGKGEGETFLLWFDALKDTSRQKNTITHLLSMDLNVENLSYLPLQFYRTGYWNEARKYILHLADPSTARREYPEVSYGVIEAIVQGLMGLDANAATGTVTTLYRATDVPRASIPARAAVPSRASIPSRATVPAHASIASLGTVSPRASDTPTAQLTDVPIFHNTTINIEHRGARFSSLRNNGNTPLQWKAMFSGSFRHARLGTRVIPLKTETNGAGQPLSFIETTVPAHSRQSVSVF